jgi:O-antigen/teichoic acid export membrane protein
MLQNAGFVRKPKLNQGERSFIRNVAIFFTGRSSAAAVTFLLTPVISRLFTPEHFGMTAVFLAVVSIVGAMSCAGYDKAINVARSVDDARKLVRLCIVLTLTMSVAMSPAIIGLAALGVVPRSLLDLGAYLWLLPIAIALEGISWATGGWLLRHKAYKRLSTAEVVQTSVRSGARVAAGFAFGSSVGSLLWRYVIAMAAKIWVIGDAIKRTAPIGKLSGGQGNLSDLRRIAKNYSDFPRYNMVTALMMQLTSQLPIFVLGSAFGAQIVGFLAMADRIMSAPINITSNTLRQVLLQKLSEIWNSERPIRRQLSRTVAVLFVIGVIPAAIFWISGEELFAWLLGERWRTAGHYIQLMVPLFLVMFLGAPFQAATAAMRRQRLWFWLEMGTAGARFLMIPVAHLPDATPELVLRVYVWTTVCTKVIAYITVYFRVPRKHPGFRTG